MWNLFFVCHCCAEFAFLNKKWMWDKFRQGCEICTIFTEFVEHEIFNFRLSLCIKNSIIPKKKSCYEFGSHCTKMSKILVYHQIIHNIFHIFLCQIRKNVSQRSSYIIYLWWENAAFLLTPQPFLSHSSEYAFTACSSASMHSCRQCECLFESHESHDRRASCFYRYTDVFRVMSQTWEM